ncbi:hypothetical protein [Lactobacillus sp. W8172]|nr:hypothetical protein [Lactobacillus sp. W8172]MBI0022783.1 hypothetical protein [Lactobacillus sp. W8172]
MKYTIDDFAHLIDYTNLCADATNEVQSKFCTRSYKGNEIGSCYQI